MNIAGLHRSRVEHIRPPETIFRFKPFKLAENVLPIALHLRPALLDLGSAVIGCERRSEFTGKATILKLIEKKPRRQLLYFEPSNNTVHQ
jgi:hypothetical protein